MALTPARRHTPDRRGTGSPRTRCSAPSAGAGIERPRLAGAPDASAPKPTTAHYRRDLTEAGPWPSVDVVIKVVIPGDDPPQIQGSHHLERLRTRPEIDAVQVYRDRPGSHAELVQRTAGAQLVINSRGAVRWPAQVLQRLPELRLIATCSIGTDMIDLPAAQRCGVVVSNQPGRTAPVVAEHACGLMFALAKHAAYHTAQIRAGRWPRVDGVYLQGKVLGIVGTGDIGAEMARLGNAVGMEVVAWTFTPTPERAARLGVRYVALEELLADSDVVSLHLRLSADSQGLIGAPQLALMKPGALLINTARGGLVDSAALADALNRGTLFGAALDVFEQEPPSPDDPLLRCERVVLTPHAADMTPEGVELLNEGAVDNVIAFLDGAPRNVVTE